MEGANVQWVYLIETAPLGNSEIMRQDLEGRALLWLSVQFHARADHRDELRHRNSESGFIPEPSEFVHLKEV